MKGDLRAELVAKLDALRPFVELVEAKGFRGWKAHIEDELELLEKWGWNSVSTSDPLKMSKAFAELGLQAPSSFEELHGCWLAFRSARNYMRAKLDWLDAQVARAKEVEGRLAKLSGG